MKAKQVVNGTVKFLIAFVYLITCFASFNTISANALTIELEEYYYFASALDTNQVLDVQNGSHRDGANIRLYRKNGTDAQLFKIIKSNENGYYYIINKGSGKAIDVEGGGTASGTNVQLYSRNETQAQKWSFHYAYNSKENVSIRAYCGKFLDVCGGETKNGTNIWIYDGNNTLSQAFKLIPFINTSYETVVLEFDDFKSWDQAIVKAQKDVTGFGNTVTNPNGNKYYTGKIITGIDVLSWKDITIQVPINGPGAYQWKTISFPQKIRFKLHSHDVKTQMYFDMSRLRFWQQCSCGYRDEWEWEIPWPDFSDTQTTDSVIKSIRPIWHTLYTVQQ